MALCDELLAGLDPVCDAFKRIGGLKGGIWIGNFSSLSSTAPFAKDNTTKVIEDINLKTGKKIFWFNSRPNKHNFSSALNNGENIQTVTNTLAMVLYTYTQLEQEAIESLMNQDDLFAIVETNNGQFYAIGFSDRDIVLGLRLTGVQYGSGTAIQDSTAWQVTLAGESTKFPIEVNLGTYADTKAFLNGLLVAAA